jgi:drug/metabolite transporter (DMT)-like permease
VCLSKAYGYAPAGKIGPANYLAIIFAGIWAWLLWGEVPDNLRQSNATKEILKV